MTPPAGRWCCIRCGYDTSHLPRDITVCPGCMSWPFAVEFRLLTGSLTPADASNQAPEPRVIPACRRHGFHMIVNGYCVTCGAPETAAEAAETPAQAGNPTLEPSGETQ